MDDEKSRLVVEFVGALLVLLVLKLQPEDHLMFASLCNRIRPSRIADVDSCRSRRHEAGMVVVCCLVLLLLLLLVIW